MSFNLNDVATFLADNNFTNVFINRMPETPDSAIAFMNLGGAGANKLMDFEVAHVDFRVRDASAATAETTALSLHALWIGQAKSFQMGNTWIVDVDAVTGAPAYIGIDTQRRTTFHMVYMLTSALPS